MLTWESGSGGVLMRGGQREGPSVAGGGGGLLWWRHYPGAELCYGHRGDLQQAEKKINAARREGFGQCSRTGVWGVGG